MRWINFADGSSYTLAADIQKFAEANGYKVPCEQDGTRHPGTDCNLKMRAVMKDAGMRHTFGITEYSVVEIVKEDSSANEAFMLWLVANDLVSVSYGKRKVVHLYAPEAVDAVLSVMLKAHVEYTPDANDREYNCFIDVTKTSHSLEKAKYRPKASLFKK